MCVCAVRALRSFRSHQGRDPLPHGVANFAGRLPVRLALMEFLGIWIMFDYNQIGYIKRIYVNLKDLLVAFLWLRIREEE